MYLNPMNFPTQNLLLALLLITTLIAPPSGLAETREKQVSIESKFVEVSNAQTRELGVDWDSREQKELGQDRGLQHLGQTGNLAQNKSIFDFKPLDFNPPQPQTKPAIQPIIPTQVNETPQMNQTGVILNAVPEVDANGNVKMTLKPEVSELSALTFKPSSYHVVIPDGQTLAMGGLMSASEPKESKVPGLGEVPLIGTLFRSRTDKSNKKNLTVFITPTLVDPHGQE